MIITAIVVVEVELQDLEEEEVVADQMIEGAVGPLMVEVVEEVKGLLMEVVVEAVGVHLMVEVEGLHTVEEVAGVEEISVVVEEAAAAEGVAAVAESTEIQETS